MLNRKIMNRYFFYTLLICVFFDHSCTQKQDKYDIVVYGGTSSGVIAAYSATKLGKKVLLIEPGYRLGGLTSGGLGQTDIGNKHAVTGLSRNFYRRIGQHYGKLEAWHFEPMGRGGHLPPVISHTSQQGRDIPGYRRLQRSRAKRRRRRRNRQHRGSRLVRRRLHRDQGCQG